MLMESWPGRLFLAAAIAITALGADSYAQRGGDRGDRGDRGGDRGDRGGDRGDRGGDRGDRGGDRGDRGGGPPGGGFGGRPSFGGGPPGGGFGGGPPRGGFDPSEFIRRLDTNRNGMIDPNESEGRARFMLQRIMRDADFSRPIPLDQVTKSFDEARQRWSGGDRSGNRDSENKKEPTVEPLVPGFGVSVELPPVPGFGDAAELYGSISAEDRERGQSSLARYDRNKDGILDADEVRRGRWRDDPYQYDFNGDKKLTLLELSARYAKRRLVENEQRTAQSNSNRGSDDRRSDDRRSRYGDRDNERKKEEDQANKLVSYRLATAHERLPQGLPDWFVTKDLDLDGQIMMAEFSTAWTDSTVEEFAKYDVNSDGILTPKECLAANGSVSSTPSPSATASTPASTSDAPESKSSSDSNPSTPAAPSSTKVSSAYLAYATGVIKKYDKNGDQKLSKSEWSEMSRDPSAADTDADGKITVAEYASFLNNKWN